MFCLIKLCWFGLMLGLVQFGKSLIQPTITLNYCIFQAEYDADSGRLVTKERETLNVTVSKMGIDRDGEKRPFLSHNWTPPMRGVWSMSVHNELLIEQK
jgi:hypothetical protein